jgi:two-component system, NtrC family, nitrogen regulation sensor histidine kinase NtrY
MNDPPPPVPVPAEARPSTRNEVPRHTRSHERRVLLLALLGPLPALLTVAGLLAFGDYSSKVRWTLALVVGVSWLAGAFALRERVVRALQTVTNLLGAMREGDFSVRGRGVDPRDALGEALAEINTLADTLARQRTGAVEATALLSKVMAEIDVAVLAFDRERRLRLVNRAGERLLSPSSESLLGASADTLGVAGLLEGDAPRTLDAAFPGSGGPGQWELRRSSFRLGGLPHELVVLTDLRRALREEERQAWQRLVRVLGHEINNSLAPIRSIAGDLQQTVALPPAERAADWQEDVTRGLAVIERRSESLGRFMNSYARLARLPPPSFAPVDVGTWLRRVVDLEKRLHVRLAIGPPLTVLGDSDQLEQLLINLVKNGVEAAQETGGGVEVSWRKLARQVEVVVADEGPGLPTTHNLFVPFFTTKPAGSGIGLVLSRQIAEAHRGTLLLEPRRDRTGAAARLRLPL